MQIATIDCCNHSAMILKDKMVCLNCLRDYKIDDGPQETIYPHKITFIDGEAHFSYNIYGDFIVLSTDGKLYDREFLGGTKLDKSMGEFLEKILL